MDRYRMQNLWKKTKDFLVSKQSKEFFVFLFFLLVAAVFWLLQTLDETLEKEVSIGIKLVNVPEDVVITSPLPEELKVVVSDKGTSLIHYIRHGVEPLQISFTDYESTPEYGKVRLQNTDVQKKIQSCLLGSSRIKSYYPDTLEFYYNHGLCKAVPVKIAGSIGVSPDYYLLDVSTTPSDVLVYASPSILDTLTAVWSTPVNLQDIAENTTKELKLQGIKGAKFSAENVKLEVLVDVYMEKTINVPIHTSNFPADKSLRTFPSDVQVIYTIGYALSNKIQEEDFVILLTYEQILGYQKEGKTNIPLTLRNVPEGVMNVRIDPTEVDYLIETKNDVE